MPGEDIHSDLELHDVAIVGAGPCGLAVASRLSEATPSALFTDLEHQRYHFIRKHADRAKLVESRGRANAMKISPEPPSSKPVGRYSMVVIDSTSNTWLGKWKRQFESLGIKQLRSPLFFHPDPRDRDGLKEFAHQQGRDDELDELKGVAGKEISKHHKKKAKNNRKRNSGHISGGIPIDERDAQDYWTPSNSLFCDYCSDIICNYTLSDLIVKAEVASVTFSPQGSSLFPDTPHFSLSTSTGMIYSRVAVLAIGPGSSPSLPRQIPIQTEGACHTSRIAPNGLPAPHVGSKISRGRETSILVVGGGLTSAQICDLCLRKGVNRVYHIMRSHYKVKHFDVDLPWVAKYRNLEMAAFWIADDDEERFSKICDARGGGSITPYFKAVEARHVASGRLQIHTQTEIVAQAWNPDSKTWKITTEPPIDGLPAFDYIYYATGSKADIGEVRLLEDIRSKWPIRTVGGLPCLTDDLSWSDEVPLFIGGRFAGLKLGPGAANLEGARVGAERIAWKVEELLRHETVNDCDKRGGYGHDQEVTFRGSSKENWRKQYTDHQRIGNLFEALSAGDAEIYS